jgi:predicted transposase/invertase (TIGR01784 family)
MTISKDTLWKGIIENLFSDFLWFFFEEYADQIDFDRGFVFLDSELEKLLPDNEGSIRHADKLVRVWLLNGEEAWFLIHVEVQGYPDEFFSRRMFEISYQCTEKYQHPVVALAIFTDKNRSYHQKRYYHSFMGTTHIYEYNAYSLIDHPKEELALNTKLFAIVMEAAWQYLEKPEDENLLAHIKLDLIRRLLKRNVDKDKIRKIIQFISLYVGFTKPEIQHNFVEELKLITKADKPMGIEEAIQEELKSQGREEGREEEREHAYHKFIPQLYRLGMSLEDVAALNDIPLEKVSQVIENWQVSMLTESLETEEE